MEINVFEGSCRVALLLQTVWVIGCMIVLWVNTPSVSLTYETEGPSAPFMKTRECVSRDDHR
jgi:hypothetical protein